MSSDLSHRFDLAVTRLPAETVANGLRDRDIGDPDAATFRAEHAAYRRALESAGVDVVCLSALEAFPDSVFVEDPALCLPGFAILLRPGAESRRGEAEPLRDALADAGLRIIDLPAGGFVDGGDILVTDKEVVIGLSARTDAAGANALAEILAAEGFESRIVSTPTGILHLKTGCATLGGDRLLVDAALLHGDIFKDYNLLPVPDGERYAANVIRVNDLVLVPQGYPRTEALLVDAGYAVRAVPTGEARKLDGGLSCMSLRICRG